LRRWLHEIGLEYATAATKRTPDCILRAPRECVVAYLQGLFDTDGYVDRKYGNVFLTTASRQLALETQMLLLNLGIVASRRIKTVPKGSYYEIAIHGEDAIRFHQTVGFRLRRKQERASLASEVRHPNNGNNPRYTVLSRLVHYCRENNIDCHELEILLSQGYLYDSITRLETSQAVVYDLNIEPDHNYIAQGFVSHNSTYIRQNALIVLMAHIGSFVPADRAEIGLVDRIFTRVGARDELATGQSTFMVEMIETANILNNASPRSLVILDEIGRGTSTYDGLAIAWAVAEYLHALGCKVLFATHYHYLNELANRLEGVANYRVAVKEQGDRIIWLHKVLPGGTDRSYGIHVARMSGVPPEVIERAEQILREFERRGVQASLTPPAEPIPTIQTRKLQLTLFEAEEHPLLEELRQLDPTALTPVEALMKLDEWKRRWGRNPR
jgi:DNA mismatch repair protein MutS